MMTEQEIIKYLKENKNKGVAFAFLPKDVQAWCEKHRLDKSIFKFYTGTWTDLTYVDSFDSRYTYCLNEDYKPKPQFEPYWEEFEIDKEGFFRIKKESYIYYCWFNWQKFLDDNLDKYSNFGGWLYNDGERQVWTSNPCFEDDDGVNSWAGSKDDIKPAIPVKIRFWRYAE